MHVGLIIHMFTYVRDNKPDKNERNNWTKLRIGFSLQIENERRFIEISYQCTTNFFFKSEISVHESYKGGLKVVNFFCKWFLVWPLRWNHTKQIQYCFVLWHKIVLKTVETKIRINYYSAVELETHYLSTVLHCI